MYKAIFKTDEVVDALILHKEFSQWSKAELKVVYSDNPNWTGVCVYNKLGLNYLAELPALESLLTRLGLEHVTGVTYFNMAPKSTLHRHRDMHGNLLFGISRLHIPIKTNVQAILEVERKFYNLALNEIWCLDTSGLHAAWNNGEDNRIHMVIDVRRHRETEKYFPRWSPSVIIHLARFIVIVSLKVTRDIVYQPKSLLKRILDFKRGL